MIMETYELTVSKSFAAAHRLREYEGKCANLHGHNFKVEATVEAKELDELGMALDFGRIKEALNRVLERLDHSYLNDLPAFKDKNPTSENIAAFIWEEVSKEIKPFKIAQIKVYESESSSVTYKKTGRRLTG